MCAGSHFLTTPHDLHRRRRKPLEPFFSRLGVTRLEPMIAEVVGLVNRRFEALRETGTVIRLDHVFVAFSGDVIGRLCCEDHTDMLEDAEFTPQWLVENGDLMNLCSQAIGSTYYMV